jgi:hypothetical protein
VEVQDIQSAGHRHETDACLVASSLLDGKPHTAILAEHVITALILSEGKSSQIL